MFSHFVHLKLFRNPSVVSRRKLIEWSLTNRLTCSVTRPSFSEFRPMLPVGLPAVAEVRNDNFTGDGGTVSSYGTLTRQILTTNSYKLIHHNDNISFQLVT